MPTAIQPLHAWASEFEKFWQHQLLRVKERAEAESEAKASTSDRIPATKCQKEEIMIQTAPSIENMTLEIKQEMHVHASLEVTFEALLEQIGPDNERSDGRPDADEARGVAGRALVPRPGRRTTATSGAMCRPSSGPRCWRSAGRCSRLIRLSNNVQYRLSGEGRRHADHVPAHGARVYRRTAQEGVIERLGVDSGTCPRAGRAK